MTTATRQGKLIARYEIRAEVWSSLGKTIPQVVQLLVGEGAKEEVVAMAPAMSKLGRQLLAARTRDFTLEVRER